MLRNHEALSCCGTCRADSLSLMGLRSSMPTRMREQQTMHPWTRCLRPAVAQKCERV